MRTIDDLIRSRETQIARLQTELESLHIAARLMSEADEEAPPAKPMSVERPSKDGQGFDGAKRNQFV